MNAIIIAAGSGKRISKDVESTPKSLINVNGKSIINYQIEILRKLGIQDIIIITGKFNEKFDIKNVNYVHDTKHEQHDILGSLMEAKKFLKNDILIMYSDIIFESKILEQILNFNSDISVAIDLDWEKNYLNRSDHPKSEAENVLLDSNNNILQIKKNIENKNLKIGEFLGIMKFSNDGCEIFLKKYDDVLKKSNTSFHDAPSISKAYLTDMIQELIDCKIKVDPIFISGKWYEIDTLQDLKNAEKKLSNYSFK
tara:strand:+ start:309 stop:1070 length:762 start_codon:yes stop_codon:yes gene_type:complete